MNSCWVPHKITQIKGQIPRNTQSTKTESQRNWKNLHRYIANKENDSPTRKFLIKETYWIQELC